MVYYGTFSKGCERCRQRKVKCDMRKPGCSRCEKSAKECPGYRNLSDILFRDESKRIARKIRKDEQSRLPPSQAAPENSVAVSEKPSNDSSAPMALVQLTQPVNELGATFFFSKYTFNESPFAGDYHEWLTRSYVDDDHVLRAAIEAVGTAALSNVYYAPGVASASQERYCSALAAINQALGDPVEAVADTTLMAIILLGMFETVTFATSDRYGNWAAHVNGATEVLKLRGRNQFNQPRQGLLYVMIRSQILMVCMQQHLRVPLELVGMTSSFQSSDVRKKWQQHKIANQGSMCQISFRIVNLSASLHDGEVEDPHEILDIAHEIERDLEAWRRSGPREWGYITVVDDATAVKDCFDGKLHVYPSSWAAEAWNNWRVLKLYIKHIILEHGLRLQVPDQKQTVEAVTVIRQLSIEICMSALSFNENPRISSLIRPLYFVASEVRNARRLRSFAIEQLLYIGSSMGIRQASLLANDLAQSLDDTVETNWIRAGILTIPLVPFF